MQFQYRAIQSDGSIVEGRLEAGSRAEALSGIESRGFTPIHVAESASESGKSSLSSLWNSKKIPHRQLEGFTRMLASLLAAGIPLSKALVIIHKETTSPAAAEVWGKIHERVIDGMTLADAMAQFPETFPRVYVAMVQAGETGGFLDVVLNQIADFQTREKELRARVTAALIYPVVLLCLAIAVLIFLLIFFIPRFQTIFSGFGADLPLITQIIVGASEWLRSYGIFIALGIGGIVYFTHQWLQTDQGRRRWENTLLQIPMIGVLNSQLAMARFCRMLGTLLSAGVPLIAGLQVARKSIHNQILVDTVTESIERVKKGEPLAMSLSNCRRLFPGSVLEIISVAEEAGRLDQELIRISDVTESDLDRRMKIAVSLAEPLMLFLIAGFIGTIFIGMVIPIFTIQDYIK